MKNILIFCIDTYQAAFQLQRRMPHCKYFPSCSEYTKTAIVKHGTAIGLLKGAWRIIRCNPLSKGGVDLP
jgi:putative membrane protein insertion efficiency factor